MTLKIFRVTEGGTEKLVREISESLKSNKIEVEWAVEVCGEVNNA